MLTFLGAGESVLLGGIVICTTAGQAGMYASLMTVIYINIPFVYIFLLLYTTE